MSQKLIDSSYHENYKPPSFCFRNQQWRIFFCQLIGTALLVTGVCCTIYKNPVKDKVPHTVMMHDLYVILTLYMARCFFAPLTGGYFNVAVTLGVFLNKNSNNKITAKKFMFYIMAQFIGAAIGAAIGKIFYDANTGPFNSQINYSTNDLIVRFFGQLIGTTIFVHMVLILTTDDTTFINEECWVHLFVPIFLYGGRKLSKYIDGLNPFQLIALQIVTSIFTENGQSIHVVYMLIISVAQLLGGLIAAAFFNYVYFPTVSKWRNQQ